MTAPTHEDTPLAAAGANRPQTPEVSVVIPSCRRPELLRRCLAALARQTLAPECFEVLVVDDGRDNATRAVAVEFARTHPRVAWRYLRPGAGTRGPAAARNGGWRAAAAPLIAFTDDDTVPADDWLAEGLRTMAANRLWDAASGCIVVPHERPPTDHARNTAGLAAAEFVTANAFVRVGALARVGGFDERFTRAWREDSDLQFSILESGGRIGRAARARVAHPVRPAPWGVSIAQQRNVAFDALLYRKHPAFYRQRIRRRPPWLYAAIVAATAIAVIALLAAAWIVAAIAAAGALAGIAVFAAHRLRGASHAPAHVAEMLVTSGAIPFVALWWRAVGAWRYRTLFP